MQTLKPACIDGRIAWFVGYAEIIGAKTATEAIFYAVMKAIRFIPLTFLAGAQGFPLFVSYLLLVGAGLHVYRRFR